MHTSGTGKKQWVIPGGHVPLTSTGPEPEFTSHDKLSILNTSPQTAKIELTIYFANQEPYGPYEIEVESRRLKKVRFNDLIDPLPIMLNEPYACVLQASQPVVVQFSRQHTAQPENTGFTTMAFAQPEA